jgi:NAD+ kinase
MKKFCIIANRDKDEDLTITRTMLEFLTAHGKEVYVTEESSLEGSYTDVSGIPKDVECAIVLGGDGTILQAAHDLLELDIPILGVNLGTLGFLAEIEVLTMEQAFTNLFLDQYNIESRMMIDATIFKEDQSLSSLKASAINDVVITRSGFSRIIGVSILINGEVVQNYRGDGVIISTPTGSTGYNLSAGGPIVTPKAEMIMITPICPHSLNARSIIVTSEDTVEIQIRESKKTQEEEAIITVDGSFSMELQANDRILIKKAKERVKLVRLDGHSFFHLLRTKFGDK